jgi:hypothetical protein
MALTVAVYDSDIRYSVYLLSWYKSTNTDAEGAGSTADDIVGLVHVHLADLDDWVMNDKWHLLLPLAAT